jgi:hypothetical protein
LPRLCPLDSDILLRMRDDEARSPFPLSPFRLETSQDPDDKTQQFHVYPQLPLDILVVSNFTGRPDSRCIEDRQPVRVRRDNFDKVLTEHKLSFQIALGLPALATTDIRVRRLSDFEAASLAAQISSQAPLDRDSVERALAIVYRDPNFLEAERSWRSLWPVVEEASEDLTIEIMNASAEDLIADFEDAPSLSKSGLFRMANRYNHQGMRPYAALVMGHALRTTGPDGYLIRKLGEIARAKNVPVLVNAAEEVEAPTYQEAREHAAWQKTEDARFVAICAPPFVLRRAYQGSEVLEGAASFLVARLLITSFARYLYGSHLFGALPGVDLVRAVTADESERCRPRGYLALVSESGASLVNDPTCSQSSLPSSRSLSAQLLLTRFAHQILNIDHRRAITGSGERDVRVIAERLNQAMATRLRQMPGVSASVSDLEWCDPPALCADAILSVTVPSPSAEGSLTLQEKIRLQFEF